MNFEPMKFIHNLSYMGLGMLGILIVMGIIMIVMVLLEKITSRKKEENKDSE